MGTTNIRQRNFSDLPKLLALVPETMAREAEKLLQQRRVFTLFSYASNKPKEIWENISQYFYTDCRQDNLKVVVLNDWLRVDKTGDKKDLLANYQAMADVAKKIQSINPTIKLFAFPTGGVYEALVHKIGAKMIFSWFDPLLLAALQA